MKTEIKLEDKGQDALIFIVEDDIITKTIPFQTEMWKGAYVPVRDCEIGKEMPIHNPPYVYFGFLKYKIIKITNLNNN